MKILTNTTAIVLVLLMANFNLLQAQSRCIHCGMDIKDRKFKAQAQYTSGKIVEFDAIECLINFTKSKDPADPQNYGGEIVRSGLGFNFLLANNTLILGMELNTPLYRNYNGVQMDEEWGLNTSLRYNVL